MKEQKKVSRLEKKDLEFGLTSFRAMQLEVIAQINKIGLSRLNLKIDIVKVLVLSVEKFLI